MADFDRTKFNTDPKHEKQRNDFDAMVEDSVARLVEKKKKESPPKPEDKNVFDAIAEWFGQ